MCYSIHTVYFVIIRSSYSSIYLWVIYLIRFIDFSVQWGMMYIIIFILSILLIFVMNFCNKFYGDPRTHTMAKKILLNYTACYFHEKRWWLIEGEQEGTYCANDRLIVAFRNTTRSIFRLVEFVSYRRVFRTLLRLALPTAMAVVTQKDILLLSSQLFRHFRYQ